MMLFIKIDPKKKKKMYKAEKASIEFSFSGPKK